MAIIIGLAIAALALLDFIILAALWNHVMATLKKASDALAKIAAIGAALGPALEAGNIADADLAEINTNLDKLGAGVPGYADPTAAPADPNA